MVPLPKKRAMPKIEKPTKPPAAPFITPPVTPPTPLPDPSDKPNPPKRLEELYCMTEDEAKRPYDPSRPNDYEKILQERRRRRFEEELRRKKAQELRELDEERITQAEMDLELTGEQAYLKRALKSAAMSGEEKAFGMMKKMGWAGKGLGKEEQGIVTPLMMKKTDKMAGVIVPASKPELPKGTVLSTPPTKVVLLKNISPEDADEDLKNEMVEGCKAYGNVLASVCGCL
eukprot:TRINITY_DN15449_c0_g1_i1.p1 TRINITY_DN15449_c0_g1~~TRINITY_DN15449_c0_g1_i1.p1  ORF type:complete len:230 (+),score=82.16 TRINITY_DN15449_c0_g1_i1:27-716(+)